MTSLLIDDHAEVSALLRALDSAFDRGRPREVLDKLDYLWARLAVHIRAEHLHLFPALLAASDGVAGGRARVLPSRAEVLDAVRRLREDHDFFMRVLAEAVNVARVLAADADPAVGGRMGAISDGVLAVEGRLGEHNRLEEEQVYRWQTALLSEEEQAGLRVRMRLELQNLPPRFSGGVPAE